MACFGPRRGIERPRGTFVGGGAAATLGALSSASSPKFCFRAASGGAARACGRVGVCRGGGDVSGGGEGLHADTRKPSQTGRCFFRGKGRLGRRREPWRGRGAPREGCGGDASMQPVYLGKGQKKQKRRAKRAALQLSKRLATRLYACAGRRVLLGQRSAQERHAGRGNRRNTGALSRQLLPRATSTPPPSPRRDANNNSAK